MRIHWFKLMRIHWEEVNENTLVQRKLMRIHWFRGS